MSGTMSRNKGARAEVAVVNYLRAQGWPDTRRYLAGDGRQPGDIDWHPLVCLEVKDRKSSSWPSWCRQVAAEARPGMVPVVVRKQAGVTDPGLWECRYLWADWPNKHEAPRPDPLAPYWARLVDGEYWAVTTLANLIAAVWALDHPEVTA